MARAAVIPTEQLLQELEAKYWKLGRFPSVEDIEADSDMHNSNTYMKRIGLQKAKRVIMQRIREAGVFDDGES